MSEYLVLCCVKDDLFSEVWDDVAAVQNLREGGDFTLAEALRYLDKVDREGYSKLSENTWIWRLHGE